MAPSDREQTFMQRFYLYMAMTKPSERLYITYSEVDSDGTAMRPSYIINMLDRMLPGHSTGSYEDEILWAESVYSAKRVLSDTLRELSYGHDEDVSKDAGIISFFEKHDKKTLGRLLEAADYHYSPDPISQAVMRAIDGGVIRGSVSRMESYASCAERYFLQYILKLFEPPEVGLEVVDMGTLYHDALYLYEDAVKKSGKDMGSISAEESEKLLNKAISEAFGRIKKPHILSSARQSYILRRMEKTLKRTVWALGRQVAAGDYMPEGFEISLGELSGRDHIEVPLDDRLILSLSGRIDRFDLMKKERSRYLKVIDYKSSSKKISYPRVYYGLQLQLLYYMSNLMRYEKERHPDDEIIPAAAFYYALLDPKVDADWDMTDEQFDEQILKALKPEGMLSNNRDAVVGMDRLLGAVGKGDPGVASSVIPAKINKDGEKFADKPKLTSKDDFIDLCGYVEKKIAAIGRDIASGKMIASPYREGDENACTYCPYNSVCGFDRDIKGYEYRDIKGLSDDEALQRMREE